jgi:hypothetical protein
MVIPEHLRYLMYKGFGKDIIKKGPTVVKNYFKTYGSRFLKWARTPYPEHKKVKRRGHK